METLNVKVDRETKEKLETLVRRKLYRNTSEAVRNMLADHMQEHPDLFASAKLVERPGSSVRILSRPGILMGTLMSPGPGIGSLGTSN